MIRRAWPILSMAVLLGGCVVKDIGYSDDGETLLEKGRKGSAANPRHFARLLAEHRKPAPSPTPARPRLPDVVPSQDEVATAVAVRVPAAPRKPLSSLTPAELSALPAATATFLTRFERLSEAGNACQAALVRDYPDLALGTFRALTRTGVGAETAARIAEAWSMAFGSTVLVDSQRILAANARSLGPILKELSSTEQAVEAQATTAQAARGHLDKLRRAESALAKLGERVHAEDVAQLAALVSSSLSKPGDTTPVAWKSPSAPTPPQELTRAILECGIAIRRTRIDNARRLWWRAMELQAAHPSPVTLQRMEELRDFIGEIGTPGGSPSPADVLRANLELARRLLARNEPGLAARHARLAQQMAKLQSGESSAEHLQAQFLVARAAMQGGDTRNALALAVLAESGADQKKDASLYLQARALQADVMFAMRRMPRARTLYREAQAVAVAAGLHSDADRMTLNEAKAALQDGDVDACRLAIEERRRNPRPLGSLQLDYDWLALLLEAYSNGRDLDALRVSPRIQVFRDEGRYDLLEVVFGQSSRQ